MKILKEKKKLKNIKKHGLCLLLAAVIISGYCMEAFAAGFSGVENNAGMEWTRVRTKDEMAKLVPKDPNDTQLNSVNGWHRILIVYNNDKYMLTGCDRNGDKISGETIKASYGVQPDKDSFKTLSSLGTPWVKFSGNYDDEHDGNKYYIRRCDNAGTGLGSDCLAINLKWYGISWSAAAEASYRPAPVSDPGSAEDDSGACCSASIRTEWTFQFGIDPAKLMAASGLSRTEAEALIWARHLYNQNYSISGFPDACEKAAEIYGLDELNVSYEDMYGDKKYYKYIVDANGTGDVPSGTCKLTFNTGTWKVHDRTWNVDGSCIDFCKGEDGFGCGMKIFIGEPCAISLIGQDYEVGTFSYLHIKDYVIDSNVILTVPDGSTLVLTGNIRQNGKIVVDGGTLVIEGYLETGDNAGSGTDSKGNAFTAGDIEVKNSGTLIVNKESVVLHRTPGACISVDSCSSIYVEGVLIVSDMLKVADHSSLRGLPGSFITVGLKPKDTCEVSKYSAADISTNKESYLSSIAEIADANSNSGIYLTNGSSLISYGGVFLSDNRGISRTGSYLEALVSTNVEATIGSMMRNW